MTRYSGALSSILCNASSVVRSQHAPMGRAAWLSGEHSVNRSSNTVCSLLAVRHCDLRAELMQTFKDER